jgi:hypothetical protein
MTSPSTLTPEEQKEKEEFVKQHRECQSTLLFRRRRECVECMMTQPPICEIVPFFAQMVTRVDWTAFMQRSSQAVWVTVCTSTMPAPDCTLRRT